VCQEEINDFRPRSWAGGLIIVVVLLHECIDDARDQYGRHEAPRLASSPEYDVLCLLVQSALATRHLGLDPGRRRVMLVGNLAQYVASGLMKAAARQRPASRRLFSVIEYIPHATPPAFWRMQGYSPPASRH
jgi:hypothetical protein